MVIGELCAIAHIKNLKNTILYSMDKKLLKTAFGAALREIRLERGITQTQLGSSLEMDCAYIAVLEGGKKMPSLEMILRLERGLGIPSGDLSKRAEQKLKEIQSHQK